MDSMGTSKNTIDRKKLNNGYMEEKDKHASCSLTTLGCLTSFIMDISLLICIKGFTCTQISQPRNLSFHLACAAVHHKASTAIVQKIFQFTSSSLAQQFIYLLFLERGSHRATVGDAYITHPLRARRNSYTEMAWQGSNINNNSVH